MIPMRMTWVAGTVWCWDITYLRSSVRGAFYYPYLIIDIYSREIVVWWVACEESMDIAAG